MKIFRGTVDWLLDTKDKFVIFCKKVKRRQVTIEDVKCFIIGYTRYFLFTHRMSFLIRKKILKIYYKRLTKAKIECFENGQCEGCGCDFPAVLFCKKGCKLGCYEKF